MEKTKVEFEGPYYITLADGSMYIVELPERKNKTRPHAIILITLK